MRIRTLILWGICSFFIQVNSNGQCDSVAIQNEINILVCPNGSYSYNGVEIPDGSSESFLLFTPEGCDSIVTVFVEGVQLDTGLIDLAACNGDSATYAGHTIAAGDSKLITVNFSDGCDSTILITVGILPSDTTFITLEICEGDSVQHQGIFFSEGDEKLLELINHNGCDSFVFISTEVVTNVKFETTTKVTCPDAAEGEIKINITNGTPPFLCAIDNGDFQSTNIFEYLKSGNYLIQVKDNNGCLDKMQVPIMEREKLELIIDEKSIPCSDPFLTIRPTILNHAGEIQFEWPDGSDKNWFHINSAGIYPLIISDDCMVEEYEIEINWGDDFPEELIYIPNAFTPNYDGHNDIFKSYPNNTVELINFELQVFDRWGANMFSANNPNDGWDGTHNLDQKNPAVFAYFLKAEMEVCGQKETIFKKGDLNLIR